MPPLPKRPVALSKTLAQSSWVERTFQVTYEEVTTEERGPTLGPIGMCSIDGPMVQDGRGVIGKREMFWCLIHLPSEHPLASFHLKEDAERLAEYLFKHYRMELELSDRQKIKEKLEKTWVKDWIQGCHIQRKWLDPEEFRKDHDAPLAATAPKPRGPLQLGVEVS